MSEREDPSSLEEALVQLYEERRQKNALAAGQAGVTHAMERLNAERADLAARLEASERELDEARAERDRQKARANGLNALLERDPAGLVWLREGVIADLHAAGWPEELPAELVQQRDEARAARARAESALHAVLAALRAGVPLPPDVLDDVEKLAAEAYEQSRAARAELVRERDEARQHAIRTRADVEARLAGADRQQVDDAIVALMVADGPDTERHVEDRLTVDLVCTVLGVPHVG